MHTASTEKELRRSLRLLGAVLEQGLATQAGPEVAVTLERLQRDSAGLRLQGGETRRRQLIEVIERLEPETIRQVVRALNRYSSLVNLAEEFHHLRLPRRQAERGGHYWAGSFHDTLLTLKQSGLSRRNSKSCSMSCSTCRC